MRCGVLLVSLVVRSAFGAGHSSRAPESSALTQEFTLGQARRPTGPATRCSIQLVASDDREMGSFDERSLVACCVRELSSEVNNTEQNRTELYCTPIRSLYSTIHTAQYKASECVR